MTEKRFTWEYSNYDSTGEIHDWIRHKCFMTDYLQKYEIKEWCQELNKIVDENNQLRNENEQLKQTLREVYDDDYYLKQFIIAIINVYSKNNGVSPIRLKMIWDSSDMDKTSLKHLKSSFYE